VNNTNSKDLVMMAVGDVHVSRPDPGSAFVNVASVLEQGDINMGNLEGPICDQGQFIPGKFEIGSAHLISSPMNIKGLVAGRFKAMGLANNHQMDYGGEGLLQTIEILDQAGIAHAGAGHNLEEAHKIALLEQKGTRVAFLSYTSLYLPVGYAAEVDKPGVATLKIHTAYEALENVLYQPGIPPIIITIPDPIELNIMLDNIRRAKEIADIVVLCPHWGVGLGYGRVVAYQKAVGRAAIDAGADLVMGSHPHRLLGMEIYKGKLICYSLGHCILDGVKMPQFGVDTAFVKCYVHDKHIQKYSLIPARINKDTLQPELLDTEQGMTVAKSLDTMSQEFGTTFTPEGEEFVIGGPKAGTPEPLPPPAVYADSIVSVSYLKNGKPFERRQSLAAEAREKFRVASGGY